MVKQCNSTVLSTSKPAFNGLPPEIRYEILKNLLHVGDIVLQFEIEPMSRRLPYCHDFENCVEETLSRYYQEETTLLGFHELSPAILAVSKSVNAEAAPVLYSKNNFKLIQFRLEAFQTSFLARIGRKNRDLIRKIEIGFCTTELWFALGPDSGRGPVLRENIPINLQRLTMSHEWSRFLHIKEANIRIAPSSLDERVVRLNKDLDIMANFLNMSMKFMPWLSKIVVGPGRKVSIVDADITVKHHKGERIVMLEPGKWGELRQTESLECYDGRQDAVWIKMIQKYKKGDRLRVEHKEEPRGVKPFFMGEIREL